MFSGILEPLHLFVILFIVLVIFGPGKLPDLGSSLGKAIKDFKKAINDEPAGARSSSDIEQINSSPSPARLTSMEEKK